RAGCTRRRPPPGPRDFVLMWSRFCGWVSGKLFVPKGPCGTLRYVWDCLAEEWGDAPWGMGYFLWDAAVWRLKLPRFDGHGNLKKKEGTRCQRERGTRCTARNSNARQWNC